MRKLITLLGLIGTITLMASCLHEPVSTTITNENGIQVEYLFEKDGIRVYRFSDGCEHHYFTTRGETISETGDSKNRRDENINTQLDKQ